MWSGQRCPKRCFLVQEPPPPDGGTEKEKRETAHGWSCGQGFPGVGCRGRLIKLS